jgi:hypothetical protein
MLIDVVAYKNGSRQRMAVQIVGINTWGNHSYPRGTDEVYELLVDT